MSIELALIPIAIAVIGTMKDRKRRSQGFGQDSQTPYFVCETRMKDADLLEKALSDYGCRSVRKDDGCVDSAIDGTQIRFERSEQDNFEAVFVGAVSAQQAEQFLTDVYEQYTLQVQQQVYQNLLARAADRGLALESEQVQPDGSIVLTLAIQEGR